MNENSPWPNSQCDADRALMSPNRNCGRCGEHYFNPDDKSHLSPCCGSNVNYPLAGEPILARPFGRYIVYE
jgi:hypothetical protein